MKDSLTRGTISKGHFYQGHLICGTFFQGRNPKDIFFRGPKSEDISSRTFSKGRSWLLPYSEGFVFSQTVKVHLMTGKEMSHSIAVLLSFSSKLRSYLLQTLEFSVLTCWMEWRKLNRFIITMRFTVWYVVLIEE